MNLPEDFEQYTSQLMGEERFQAFRDGLSQPAPVSIRLNPNKANGFVCPKESKNIPWCKEGFYLAKRPNFTFDPFLHTGLYYVQEASSMFLSTVLQQTIDSEPIMMLDLCAAPGGKSTLALSALPKGSLLVTNEPVRPRAQILSENIQKWGNPNVIVTNNYPREYKKTGVQFDIILCDVPCSGEGMFRKDENAIAEWNRQKVDKCSQLQREIISDIWPCLKEGGILIYSTCTFNTKENEENVAWIAQHFEASFISINTDGFEGITGSLLDGFNEPVYRFIPGITKGEGLFMAVLRKKGTEEMSKPLKQKKHKLSITGELDWLVPSKEFVGIETENLLYAIPKYWSDVYLQFKDFLHIIHAGICYGKRKGKDIIPEQSLALSTFLNRRAFVEIELPYQQAIDYLRTEAISLPADTPKGIILVTFHGIPLGFVKNIGNRANNLYPKEWKIKSTYIPDYETIFNFA